MSGSKKNLRRVDRGQARRSATPIDAWLNSTEMARTPRGCGVLRFDTIFPAEIVEIAILVTERALDLALRMVSDKRACVEGRHGSQNIDRHPRTARTQVR